jgi:hypothetical protein
MKSLETQIPVPSLSSDLRTTNCLNCGATSEQVLNMETRKRVGWYCLNCYYFEQAILRETVIHKVTKVHI